MRSTHVTQSKDRTDIGKEIRGSNMSSSEDLEAIAKGVQGNGERQHSISLARSVRDVFKKDVGIEMVSLKRDICCIKFSR